MIEAAWTRAHLLFGQRRWDLAERELRRLLTDAPEFGPAHALLAITLAQTGQLDEALRSAREAVTLDPESDDAFHALACVQLERHDLDAAAGAIDEAVRLAPDDPRHRGMLANVRWLQQRWTDCVAAADAGLRLDPQDTDCLNLRSLALAKLGRTAEADASVEASLAHDPDNAFTHQARGFQLLQQGDAARATEHFKQALRRDPTLDGARAGLVESIKTRNPIYRAVLAPFVWMERFPPARRTQILIGAWLLAQVASRSLRGAGHVEAATVVSFSWLAVVLVTACIVPIFNLMLLLHPVGRHALDPFAKRHALLLGAAILVAIGVFVGSWTVDSVWLDGSRLFWLLYALPIAGLGAFLGGWGRTVQIVICIVLPLGYAYWSWQLFDLLAREQVPDADVERLVQLQSGLLWGAALSTWFVLLAPKGHRPRRRG